MKRFHRSVVAGIALAFAGTGLAGCLPLPPAEVATMCPPDLRPAPTADDLAVLDRLEGRGLMVTIASPPSVWLDAHDGATAAALRSEFGSGIDIVIGSKLLGRVPGNPAGCLIEAPNWAIAEPAPKGVVITVTPSAATFDRNGDVTATLRVTNRTGRSIVVSPTMSSSCEGDPGAALSSTGSALAVNRTEGLRPLDPMFLLRWSSSRYVGTLVRGADGKLSISQRGWVCPALLQPRTTVRPGGSTTLTITAHTVSTQAGGDPLVLPGTYHLRATADIRLTTAPDEVAHRVAAPPTEVVLR